MQLLITASVAFAAIAIASYYVGYVETRIDAMKERIDTIESYLINEEL